MDVVRGDHEIQDNQAVSLFGLERPVEPEELVSAELEEEFFVVATMGDVPDVAGEEAPVRARHENVLSLC